MSSYLLSAEASFSAAHTLPGIDMCERFHGHNWRVRVTVKVEEGDLSGGMGVDFRKIEEVARRAVADFEHRYLNDLEPFEKTPPTAERVAKVISERVQADLSRLDGGARVHEIELWETPAYRLRYLPE